MLPNVTLFHIEASDLKRLIALERSLDFSKQFWMLPLKLGWRTTSILTGRASCDYWEGGTESDHQRAVAILGSRKVCNSGLGIPNYPRVIRYTSIKSLQDNILLIFIPFISPSVFATFKF